MNSGRLRVVLVADAVGGVWDYALTLAGGLLAGAAADVLLVSVGPPPDAARVQAAQAIPGLVLEVLDGRLEWMEGGHDWLHTFRTQVAHLAERWRADLLHVNQLGLAAIEARDALGAQLPVVLGVHSDLATWWKWVKLGGVGRPEDWDLPSYLIWQRDLARQALHAADRVVCPSSFLANEVAALYGLTRPPVVIHNALRALPAPLHPVRRDPSLVVVVGRAWDEAKNLELVAQALEGCIADWQVEVAGDLSEPGREGGGPPPSAPGLAYLGRWLDKPALGDLFARASVYIAASSYEAFGLAAGEAALAGCAVVANDLPSYREIWGETAAYFARNDAQALASLLDDLAAHPDEVRRRAALARQWAAARYTEKKMVARYFDLYRHLRPGAMVAVSQALSHQPDRQGLSGTWSNQSGRPSATRVASAGPPGA